MDLHDLQKHIDNRFDRLEDKVDDHLERISKSEEALIWLRGHVKLTTSIFIAVAGFLAVAYFT